MFLLPLVCSERTKIEHTEKIEEKNEKENNVINLVFEDVTEPFPQEMPKNISETHLFSYPTLFEH